MGFTFFILLLGALVFTLAQKHEAKVRRDWINSEKRAMDRRTMGHGRDNIYQFKLYCYNMRCLLELAQMDGIGTGEERDEAFYDKYTNEISQKYCNGCSPSEWCMEKARRTIIDEKYIGSWIYNILGETVYDKYGVKQPNKYQHTWTVYQSGYNQTSPQMKCLKGVCLPKDGMTGADRILKGLYYFNHATTFGKNPYETSISYFADLSVTEHFDKSIPYFEESGITLYN